MSFPPLPTEDLDHVLIHSQALWEVLRGKRLFVTGATGFFGIWLLETFAHANHSLNLGAELVGLTRDPEAFLSKVPHIAQQTSIKLWKGDVRNYAFPDGPFSHVIHAGTTASAIVPPLEMLDTIIEGTRHTLDFAVHCGAQDFLLVSSGAVYGKQPPGISHVPETYTGGPDISDPNSAYGEGKRVAELLGAIYRKEHGFRVKTARCFAFVGPHLPLDAHFAIGNFIRDKIENRPIQIKGDGTVIRSYLYSSDLTIWLWRILFSGQSETPYNLGSSNALSLTKLASLLGTPEFNSAPKESKNTKSNHYVPCTMLAHEKLDLNVTIPIEDALTKTIAWYSQKNQEHPKS